MSSEHLGPEAFVDLVEGAPVDASVRQHLDACSRCRSELLDLEQTLVLVRDDAGAAAPAPVPRAQRKVPAWVSIAAAALLTAVGGFWFLGDTGSRAPVAFDSDGLLPPVEDDEEFRLLRALSDASDVELVEVAGPVFDELGLDPSPLSPSERQRFVERLAEAMRSSS